MIENKAQRIEEMIDIFIKESNKHNKYTIESNPKLTNKSADILFDLWRTLKLDNDMVKHFVDVLINDNRLESKSFISAIALDSHYRIDEAKKHLEKMIIEGTEPSIRFNAKMTLRTWERQGWLFRG